MNIIVITIHQSAAQVTFHNTETRDHSDGNSNKTLPGHTYRQIVPKYYQNIFSTFGVYELPSSCWPGMEGT